METVWSSSCTFPNFDAFMHENTIICRILLIIKAQNWLLQKILKNQMQFPVVWCILVAFSALKDYLGDFSPSTSVIETKRIILYQLATLLNLIRVLLSFTLRLICPLTHLSLNNSLTASCGGEAFAREMEFRNRTKPSLHYLPMSKSLLLHVSHASNYP